MKAIKLRMSLLSALLLSSCFCSSLVLAQAGGPGGEEEHPLIDTVRIKGATKVPANAILEKLPMKVGGKLSRALIQTSGDEITALYKKAGADVAIEPNIEHPSDGHVAVEMVVDEKGKGGFHWPGPPGGAAGGAPNGPPPNGLPPNGPPPNGPPPSK